MMIRVIRAKRNKSVLKFLSFFVAVTFITSSILPSVALASQLPLPAPTQFVPLSQNYSFPVLKGLKLDQNNPFHIEFIIDTADQNKVTEEEASQLIKYFLAGLTIPGKDIWVNLSPYEQERIVNESLGQTDLGKDLLSQDYILKQLSSSLTYPESDTGKSYWTQIYSKVAEVAHTTKLPINTFNKVWITPDKAEVYENGNTVLITEAKLKTMLEEDYLALQNNTDKINSQKSSKNLKDGMIGEINKISSGVMRDFILPKINNEVNTGKNFATLRQVYYSLILGIWFKQKFRDSIFKNYINQAKVKGINLNDPTAKQQVYSLYIEAFQKGVYNYIKKDTDPATNKTIKRQYISGGCNLGAKVDKKTGAEYYDYFKVISSPIANPFKGNVINIDTYLDGVTKNGRIDLAKRTANNEKAQVAASPINQNLKVTIYQEKSQSKVSFMLTYAEKDSPSDLSPIKDFAEQLSGKIKEKYRNIGINKVDVWIVEKIHVGLTLSPYTYSIGNIFRDESLTREIADYIHNTWKEFDHSNAESEKGKESVSSPVRIAEKRDDRLLDLLTREVEYIKTYRALAGATIKTLNGYTVEFKAASSPLIADKLIKDAATMKTKEDLRLWLVDNIELLGDRSSLVKRYLEYAESIPKDYSWASQFSIKVGSNGDVSALRYALLVLFLSADKTYSDGAKYLIRMDFQYSNLLQNVLTGEVSDLGGIAASSLDIENMEVYYKARNLQKIIRGQILPKVQEMLASLGSDVNLAAKQDQKARIETLSSEIRMLQGFNIPGAEKAVDNALTSYAKYESDGFRGKSNPEYKRLQDSKHYLEELRGELRNKLEERDALQQTISVSSPAADASVGSLTIPRVSLTDGVSTKNGKVGSLGAPKVSLAESEVVSKTAQEKSGSSPIGGIVDSTTLTIDNPGMAHYGGIDMNGIKVNSSVGSLPVTMPMFDLKNIEGFTFRIVKIEQIKDINLALNFTPITPTVKRGETQLAMAGR